uniref:Uncharacterized protein n=1 Tax=Lepeophtheirus salmonis TaxID=72036 RepID=A0A0K2UH79_LEPSM
MERNDCRRRINMNVQCI